MSAVRGTGISIEEKRQCVFASLLQHAPEAGALRERALDRLVLGALLESSEQEPFRTGRIQDFLRFGPNSPVIRDNAIQESIARLLTTSKILTVEQRGRHAYYITPEAVEEIAKAVEPSSSLIGRVQARVLEGIEAQIPHDTAQLLFGRCVSGVFARFGQSIARTITGQDSQAEILRPSDIRTVLITSAANTGVTNDALDSLEVRFCEFLRSNHPDDQKLKFLLTQGYYLAQLLGIEGTRFNPIAEHAFAGSRLYLDTNVIVAPVLATEPHSTHFAELTKLASRIGVTLTVTRETVNETRRVAAERRKQLADVSGLPIELAEKTSDDFVSSFIAQRLANPDLTVDEFLEVFDRLPEFLERHGVEFEDVCEGDGKGVTDSDVCSIIKEEALRTRGHGKSDDVAKHDAFHYELVCSDRARARKSWFVSRDRTLLEAAKRLMDGDLPFCLSLFGFLQSISPFVTSEHDVDSMAEVFGALLDDALPSEELFDIRELSLIAEMHSDVMSTPVEKLVPAFDYVKRNVLMGHPYKPEDTTRVALGLKKFLASTTEQQTRALLGERDRLTSERDELKKQTEDLELQKRRVSEDAIAAQIRSDAERERRHEVEAAHKALTAEKDEIASHASGVEQRLASAVADRVALEAKLKKRTLQLLGIFCVFSIGVGTVLFAASSTITGMLISRWSHPGALSNAYLVVSFGIFAAGPVVLLRALDWKNEIRMVFVCSALAVGFLLSHLISKDTLTSFASLAQSCGSIGTVALFWRRK